MKNVLADLHTVLNELEEQGFQKEANSLQEIFIKVASEMDDDNTCQEELSEIVEKHGFEKVLKCLSNLFSNDNSDDTQEYAYVDDSQKTYGPDNRSFWEHSNIKDAVTVHMFNKNLPISMQETIGNLRDRGIIVTPETIQKYKDYISNLSV